MEVPPLPVQPQPPQNLPLESQWCLDRKPSLCIALEVADTAREQQLGLMQRAALPPLRGMWFPAQPAQPLRFWMHNTLAPLDMVFVRDGKVLDIASQVPVCPELHVRRIGQTPIKTTGLTLWMASLKSVPVRPYGLEFKWAILFELHP